MDFDDNIGWGEEKYEYVSPEEPLFLQCTDDQGKKIIRFNENIIANGISDNQAKEILGMFYPLYRLTHA